MAAPVQTGVEWKLGYGATAYVGYQVEDASQSQESDEEIIKDTDGATATVIDMDPRTVLSMTFLIKSTGSITPPDKNSILSLTGPNDVGATAYRVTSSSVAFSRGVSRLSLGLIREDSMAATYDA
jgi:hypothetical protein